MATFGSIPSNINFSKMNVVADIAARDALTGMVQGDACFVNGLGDNGISYFYNGTSWVPVSGQKLQRVDLAAGAGSITLDQIVSGFSELVVKYDARSDRAAATSDSLFIELDGDTTQANYHRQEFYVSDASAQTAEAEDNRIAFLPATDSPANARGRGRISIVGYDETGTIKSVTSEFVQLDSVGHIRGGLLMVVHEDGPTDAIDTSITLATAVGSLVAGSWAELWGY